MGLGVLRCLIFLLYLLLCSGTLAISQWKETESSLSSSLQSFSSHESEFTKTQLDVITPMTTVPVINPTTPSTMTPVVNPIPNPITPAVVTAPATVSAGQSWCIASQTASETTLQVALDYACGYGGGDCSTIQEGGSCYNPNTVRDHASYAFNDYYQKNPLTTSCNFGGTAVITNIDPSSGTCPYPSTSTTSSILNTTNATGATVFGLEPPSSNDAASIPLGSTLFAAMSCLLMMQLVFITQHD